MDVLTENPELLLLQERVERLEAEIALRRQAERELSDFVENAVEGLHKAGADGIILWANEAELKLLGYPPEEYIGHHVAEFHDDRTIVDCIMRGLKNGERVYNQPARLRCRDGQLKNVLIHCNGYFENGALKYSRCFTRDVTDLKTGDRDRAMLAAIVDSSDDAIISKSFDGIIRSWNTGAERIFGYTEHEAVGQAITILIPKDRLAEETEIIQRLRRGERIEHYETVRLRKDGKPVDISLTISPLRDSCGNLVGASKIARDITDRKRAECALHASEQRLASELAAIQKLQAASSSFISESDSDALYRKILTAAVDIMHSDFASMQKVDEERDALRLLAFHGFEPEFGAEFEYCYPDTRTMCSLARRTGQRVIVENVETWDFVAGTPALQNLLNANIRSAQSTPLLSRSGKLLGMITTHWREPHRPAERDLRLLDLLARQAADLLDRNQAEQQLRDADRRKDEFLATLAHELRNPLAPIRNCLHVLRITGEDNPRMQNVHEILDRQMTHLIRLVDDLLEVSRISRGKIELKKSRVTLANIINSAVETSKPLIDAAGHTLRVSLPDSPILLDGDMVRLAQVFANLLNNSAKYTTKGGAISVSTKREAKHVLVSVRDTGIGIPREMLSRVFDMFVQIDNPLRCQQDGLGIGLNLVRSLVQMHEGTVEARSDGPGTGSEFIVRLPVVEPEAAVSGCLQAPGESAPARPVSRILIVDDNHDGADSLGVLLRHLGADIQIVYSGEAALETIKTWRPGIVLLDLGLPGMDGCAAARAIRANSENAGIVLIAVTGWGQADDRRRSTAAGFDHHLVKPLDIAALQPLLAPRKR